LFDHFQMPASIRADAPHFTQGIEGGDLFFHRPSPMPRRPANFRAEISEFSAMGASNFRELFSGIRRSSQPAAETGARRL